MKRNTIVISNIATICLLAFALIITACSNDEKDNGMGSLRVSAFAYERPTVTRAADGYMDFQNIYNATATTPASMVYWVCLGNSFNKEGRAQYDGEQWTTSCNLEANSTPYDFYSYMPESILSDYQITTTLNSAISPATMTFAGVPAVIREDLIISEAVTSGNAATTDNPYDQIITDAAGQAVTFRMQHVLAKLSFSFSNPEGKSFSDMRKIVVREVQVLTPTSSNKYNVTCTMNKASAITYDWEPGDNVTPDYFAITNHKESMIAGSSVEGYLVEQEATKPFGSCYLVPFTGETIKIRAIYDVYAHDGSLIRENEISVNNNLKITNSTTVDAAKEYKINVKIIPDYLYMLADIDAGTSLEIKTE